MKHELVDLLALGRRLLEAGDRAGAAVCCGAALRIDPACLEAHNLREVHSLAGNMTAWTGVNAIISPDDDIFRFFVGHPTSISPIRDYLADGWRTLSELQRLLERCNVSLGGSGSFMEFACGHGRFTRHLKAVLPDGALHVSDVVAGSLDFLNKTFGVHGVLSHADPTQVRFPRKYQVVFVLSLFSHLPRKAWAAWLDCLWRATAPGGVLVFTTHGEKSAATDKVQLAADGFAFYSQSESAVLAGDDYGCAYARESFVRQLIGERFPETEVDFAPAHFWAGQDAYMLSGAGG